MEAFQLITKVISLLNRGFDIAETILTLIKENDKSKKSLDKSI